MKILLIYFFIFLIVLFLGIYLFKKMEFEKDMKESFSNSYSNNKLCCLYAYYEKNDLYKNNFKYFLDNGILENVDYYIIINGNCTVNIPEKKNITIYKRDNKGYDFGAFSYAIHKLNKEYDYYFFINTSVCGPYISQENKNKPWTEYFLELFNSAQETTSHDTDLGRADAMNDVNSGRANEMNESDKSNIKVVGTSINIFTHNTIGSKDHLYNLVEIYHKNKPFSHVQSMFFCIDKEYFDYLKQINFFNEEELNNARHIDYVIANKEIGLSQIALKKGWNINCILSKYKNMDYRTVNSDFNPSSHNGDPYFNNSYFGNDIDKYEVIFLKNNRSLDAPKKSIK